MCAVVRMEMMPAQLRILLLDLFGDAIDEVRIVEYSWINALHGWPRAVTRPRRIYLRWNAAQFYADTDLVLHEYFHVLKQWKPGRMTLLRYFRMSLRYGYWNNPFEIHARRFAARHRHRCPGPGSRRPVLYQE
jgi:hypothetical protein